MNKFILLTIVGLISIGMTGCNSISVKPEITTNNIEENKTEDNYHISSTDNKQIGEIITIGEIVEFDGKYIHIISGDLVEVFEYDNTNETNFYIGQSVQLIKGEEKNTLEVYERDNYTVTHTNMGDIINQISGTIIKISDEIITVKADDELIDINIYEKIDAKIGDEVTVNTVMYSYENGIPSAILILNENKKMILTITQITRSSEGVMNLLLTDIDGERYSISTSKTLMEFDITKLNIDDTLTVYYQGEIMESDPMQLDAVLIRK